MPSMVFISGCSFLNADKASSVSRDDRMPVSAATENVRKSKNRSCGFNPYMPVAAASIFPATRSFSSAVAAIPFSSMARQMMAAPKRFAVLNALSYTKGSFRLTEFMSGLPPMVFKAASTASGSTESMHIGVFKTPFNIPVKRERSAASSLPGKTQHTSTAAAPAAS